jgi:anaerobic selenocysteine-containing dehydrogenase
VEILCELGSRLVPAETLDFQVFKQHESIRQAIAKIVPGMQEMADIGIAKKEFHVQQRLLHQPQFKTASGKASFVSADWRNRNYTNEQYPFHVMSVRSEGQFNSIIYEQSDSYRGVSERWVVFMSREDMSRLGIETGQKVSLRSSSGEMRDLAVHEFSLPAGDLMVYYPEANRLTGRKTDPRSKTPAFKSIPVALEL